MGEYEVHRNPWACPLITLIAAAWAFVHVAAAISEMGRTHCWFPAEYVYASPAENGWKFQGTPPTVLSEAILVGIDRPRVHWGGFSWPSIEGGTTYFVMPMAAPEIAADPAGFVGALEKWLVAEPNGEYMHSAALTTVRAIARAGAPIDSSGCFRVVRSAINWVGVLHNASTIVLMLAGIVAAIGWANQAAARQLRATRLAMVQCPTCTYDLSGLRGDRCPECGNTIPASMPRET